MADQSSMSTAVPITMITIFISPLLPISIRVWISVFSGIKTPHKQIVALRFLSIGTLKDQRGGANAG